MSKSNIIGQNLELKLVVIGILLVVYWQAFQEIFQPITIGTIGMSLYLMKAVSLILGFLWFGTLTIGTLVLAYDGNSKIYSIGYFNFLFKTSAIISMLSFIWVALIYIFFIMLNFI